MNKRGPQSSRGRIQEGEVYTSGPTSFEVSNPFGNEKTDTNSSKPVELTVVPKIVPGVIKKTWIDPEDYTLLKSKMFTNLQDAQAYEADSKGNNYLYFQLKSYKRTGLVYTWKLLPFGKHKEYVNGMKLKDNPLARYGIPVLALIGAFSLSKMIINKFK
tara:strand:- start:9336 stop:9812 length:477 start_codon:yes stop_codon:yes gene_type:complete